ncbi:MAG: hypothetical protein WCG27_08155 [Pseudomonadota bacterium]
MKRSISFFLVLNFLSLFTFLACTKTEFDSRKWELIVESMQEKKLPQKNYDDHLKSATNGMVLYNKTATFQFLDKNMRIMDLLVANGRDGAPKTSVSALIRVRKGLSAEEITKVLNNIHTVLIFADNLNTERVVTVWLDAQISERGLTQDSFPKERVFEEGKTRLSISTLDFTDMEFILEYQLEIVQ